MIKTIDLSKSFGSLKALDKVNFLVPKGSIFGLVGANGAGKSTLLRILAGIYTADSGEALIDGKPVYENPEAKSRLVFVPDMMHLTNGGATIERMAKFYASCYPNFSYEKFDSLLAVFKLDKKRRIRSLSKGMIRQVQTVLALSCNADVLLFDETFDGLDPVARNIAKRLIYRDVCDNGSTVVLTSHSLRELEDTCDRLAMLYQGHVMFQNDVTDLKSKLFKVQLAFDRDVTPEDFKGIELLSFAKSGRVVNILVRGESAETSAKLEAMHPLLMDMLPLSLEEIFTYEMNIVGYSPDGIN